MPYAILFIRIPLPMVIFIICRRNLFFFGHNIESKIMRSTYFFITNLCLIIPSALAFNVDGFRSGMTVQEISSEAMRKGLDIKNYNSMTYYIGKIDQSRIDATMIICRDRLIGIYKSVDFDADFHIIADDMLVKYGHPELISDRLAISGSSGTIPELTMRWHVNDELISLSFTPETRDGKGNLRYHRKSTLKYMVKNNCVKSY